MYGSTYFGHPHTHHQELNNCSSSLWFYRWNVVVAVLLVVVRARCDVELNEGELHQLLALYCSELCITLDFEDHNVSNVMRVTWNK
jgi:hypothetical protein